MTSNNSNRKQTITAAIAASLLMLVFGLTYRLLAARMPTPASSTPLDPNALGGFPRQIGDWKGQDMPLDEAVLSEIHADATINRLYSRGGGLERVSLYIAASGVTVGTLVGHPPEICNVWSGSTLIHDRSTELLLEDGKNLPCRILEFSRGGSLDAEKRTVLCYYMADSEFCGNRSFLQSKVRRGSVVTSVAQIQIVASAGILAADSTTELVATFAVDSASFIARLFEDLGKNRLLSESHETP